MPPWRFAPDEFGQPESRAAGDLLYGSADGTHDSGGRSLVLGLVLQDAEGVRAVGHDFKEVAALE